MIRARAIWLRAARKSAAATGRRTPAVALATLVATGVAAIPALSSSSASSLEAEALTRARVIRAEVTARYRHAPGRTLAVTEATRTGVVESITLINEWLEPWHVVPADNGIYFAICSARARRPYWPIEASLPRRMALELAARTLLETSVDLVVVALPTARPTWLVVERKDLLANVDAPTVLDRLTSSLALIDPTLPELVGRLSRPRLFLPLPILPPPDDTIYAVRLLL